MCRYGCTWHCNAPVALDSGLRHLTLRDMVVPTDDAEGPAGIALHADFLAHFSSVLHQAVAFDEAEQIVQSTFLHF